MVRFFYFLLWVTLQYTLRIFFKTVRVINSPKEIFGRTIYVSNHAASFMDPLVVATLRRPIVFFMTRSDVFTKFTKPFLWAAHMLPIYRQHDGEDTKSKNDQVFDKSAQVLNFGRNLLIFGEGFTDDTFVRRLKPVKKGALRIGFYTLEKYNWKKKIYVAAVGVNYTAPNLIRSELLVSTSEKFCLNDYKEEYLENPNRVINELTKKIELLMQEQITHVADKDLLPLHENIMRLTRKGMHPTSSDFSISLEKRWKYSQQLAHYFNEHTDQIKAQLGETASRIESHFKKATRVGVEDSDVHLAMNRKKISRAGDLFRLIALFPLVVLNTLHCFLPYFLIKNFVEKSFKRRVFWGSVKLLLGMIVIGLMNLPLLFIFRPIFDISNWWGFTYYLSIGLFFLGFLYWKKALYNYRRKKQVKQSSIDTIAREREDLLKEIKSLIPVA